jgi:ribosomal protein S27E
VTGAFGPSSADIGPASPGSDSAYYSDGVSGASNWLKEERRRTLGDWVAFCPACGHAQRYFDESEAELPDACPTCATALVVRCPSCGGRIASAFAVECESCGTALREPTGFGVPIRRPPRRV